MIKNTLEHEVIQPFVWLYESISYARTLRVLGDCDEVLLDANKAAARDYPQAHKIIPLYTASRPLVLDEGLDPTSWEPGAGDGQMRRYGNACLFPMRSVPLLPVLLNMQ